MFIHINRSDWLVDGYVCELNHTGCTGKAQVRLELRFLLDKREEAHTFTSYSDHVETFSCPQCAKRASLVIIEDDIQTQTRLDYQRDHAPINPMLRPKVIASSRPQSEDTMYGRSDHPDPSARKGKY